MFSITEQNGQKNERMFTNPIKSQWAGLRTQIMASYWLAIKANTANNIVHWDCSATIQMQQQQQQYTEVHFQEPCGGKSEKGMNFHREVKI